MSDTVATHSGAHHLGPVGPDEVHWNLLGVVRRVVRRRGLLLGTTLAGCALGITLALVLPAQYTAEAVFLPPKSSDLFNPAPQVLFGSTDTSDLYLGMLGSRSVADDVIAHQNLRARFHVQTELEARKKLAAGSKFLVSKNSFIDVTVVETDPQLAADIANAYLEALFRLNFAMVSSGSVYRRAFFEQQIEEQRQKLAAAETDLAQAQKQSGIVSPQAEVQAGVNATAGIQAEIGATEAQLAQLLTGATEQNPQVVQLRSRLAQLRGQLARQATSGSGQGLASNEQLAGLSLDNARKAREVKLKETIYSNLVEQYDRMRLSATDPGPQLQVVDPAEVPKMKSGPSRRGYTLVCTLLGFVLGLVWILAAAPVALVLRALREEPHPAPHPPTPQQPATR